MSKLMTDYFKTVSTPETMAKVSKRKLSLIKKPTSQKSPKVSSNHAESIVIVLSSDEEKMCKALDSVSKKKKSDATSCDNTMDDNAHDDLSNSSASTIIYGPGTPSNSQTPQSSYSKSPGSQKKFFSPVKKKNLKLRTPSKVKKNLSSMLDENKEDEVFLAACSGMDDKTVFLLTIINKYLSTKELRPLLLRDSQDLLSRCLNLKKPGMKLICRLYWRKAGWYRLYQIKEISIEEKACEDDSMIRDMINNLIENNIIESTNCDDSKIEIGLEDYLVLLKHSELKSICKDLKLKISNKVDAAKCLRSFSRQKCNITSYMNGNKSDNATRVIKMLRGKLGPCFRLTESSRQTLSELYQLMYLGIPSNILVEKKLELTLIYDKIKRECYPDIEEPLDNASVVFKSREDFESYMNAQSIYEEFLNTTELSVKCQVIENVYNMYKKIDNVTMLSYSELPPWLHRFTPPYLYVKILEAGLQSLKKIDTEKYIALAVEICTEMITQKLFRQHKKAEWYAEKALILDKFLSNFDEAAEVLIEGFNSDMSEVAKDSLRPRAALIATRRTKAASAQLQEQLLRHSTKEQVLEKEMNAKHIYKLPLDMSKSRGKIQFETRSEDGRQVMEAEEFCIKQYIDEGKYTRGEHWEGKIVTTIFFLLFWDVIYARLPHLRGLYLTHYQMFPLDMFLESFYVNRKTLIEKRLKEIEDSSVEDLEARMSDTWNSRPEGELSGISRHIGWEAVREVGGCLGPRALAALCRRLAAHYGHCHSGFPDLTLWNAQTKQIKFVEVKTDSDKPSMKQKQWMHYLTENGIEAEFCYVGVNTTRCKARNSTSSV